MHIKNLRRVLSVVIVLCLFAFPASSRQNDSRTDTTRKVTIAAGTEYRAGGVHKFFFGAHYREVWTTPVKAEVLDLDHFAGGLTPLKRGGGFQTKSLRFIGKDGKQYAFRSINKDPSSVLLPDLQETLAKDILQDQVSTAHPYAALVVAPIANAVGVLNAEPRLVMMPDDPKLGQFRAEFRNVLGFIEERPNDGPQGEPGFAGSDKIVNTLELFQELDEDHDNAVDAEAFLMARLLDVFVGDWDRHVDQWRWARFKKDGKDLWYPIPRDRDQAFAKFDGLFPSFAEKRYVVVQMESFHKKKPDVFSLTYSGRHLDRRFLTELEYPAWQKVTEKFLANLTQEDIVQAVKKLPPEIYALSGDELTKKLTDRRNLLRKASDEYYRNLASYVDIKTSDQNEFAEVTRLASGDVDVLIHARDTDTGTKNAKSLYHRLFKKTESKEIRLYLLGGDDEAVVQGEGSGLTVRVIGGTGNDELVDNSGMKNYFYDIKATKIVAGARTNVTLGRVDSLINRTENTPLYRDYGYQTKPLPYFGYNVDDGIFLGGGSLISTYQFRKRPFSSQTVALGNYAFKTGAFRLRYSGLFIDFFPNVHLQLEAQATVPKEVRNFYGLGNASTRISRKLEDDDFYRVRSNDYLVRPTLLVFLSKQARAGVGVAFKHSGVKLRDNTFLQALSPQPYGVEVANLLELSSELVYDGRDNMGAPTEGYYGRLVASFFPKALDSDDNFSKLQADSRFYLGSKDVTMALRAAGERVWGRFPFYEAAFLGGSESLRGFRFQRFAGDASVTGSAELRVFLARPFILLPTDFGVFGFAETGRVWLDGDSDGSWHKDFGGGILLAPLRRDYTISIGAGVSNERTALVAGLGVGF